MDAFFFLPLSFQIFNAHEKWRFVRQEDGSNVIYAYACEPVDLMLAAANRANICSFAVTGTTPSAQPAYVGNVEGTSSASLICASCARSLHGVGSSVGEGMAAVEASSSVLTPASVGIKTFVCAMGEKEAHQWMQTDEQARTSLAVRLGVRVDLSSKPSTENDIRIWTKEVSRLQPNRTAGPPRAPTESLEVRPQLRAVLFKNGVFEKAKSTTVLLPSGNMASNVTKLLEEATGEMRERGVIFFLFHHLFFSLYLYHLSRSTFSSPSY